MRAVFENKSELTQFGRLPLGVRSPNGNVELPKKDVEGETNESFHFGTSCGRTWRPVGDESRRTQACVGNSRMDIFIKEPSPNALPNLFRMVLSHFPQFKLQGIWPECSIIGFPYRKKSNIHVRILNNLKKRISMILKLQKFSCFNDSETYHNSRNSNLLIADESK